MDKESAKNIKCSRGNFDADEFLNEGMFPDAFWYMHKDQAEKIESPMEFIAYCRLLSFFQSEEIGIETQYKIGNYRIDFKLNIFPQFPFKIAFEVNKNLERKKQEQLFNKIDGVLSFGIEIDGYEYHSGKNKEKFVYQTERARNLKIDHSFDILTFAGAEIFNMESDFEITISDYKERIINKFIKKHFNFYGK